MKLHLFLIVVLTLVNAGKGYSQDNGDISGNDPELQLIIAADRGDTLQVQQLLEKGTNVDATTWEGVTALMYAVQNGDVPMVRLLLQSGASPDLKSANGFSALITAIRSGQFETAEQLLRSGANINLPDNRGVTPLMHAIAVDSFYLADLMLYYEADFQLKSHDGIDALMMASYLGRYEITVALLELGAEVNSEDDKVRFPLYLATAGNHPEIIELLILNGAILEKRSDNGYTALSLAVSLNYFKAARVLISYGADVNSRISNSLNPMALAHENKSDSLIKMLGNQEAREIRWPYFNRFIISSHVSFNTRDVIVGLNLGFSDKKYNLWTTLGYGFRPNYIRILDQQDESNFYQYWEKRHMVSLTAEKGFFLSAASREFKAGVFFGLEEVLTFGGYRGSAESPEIRLVHSPRLGAVLEYNSLRIKLNYKFMNLHLDDYSSHWCGFSLEFLINRNKGNPDNTTINWL
jgi:ankyrin repeat protein